MNAAQLRKGLESAQQEIKRLEGQNDNVPSGPTGLSA